MKKGFYQKYNDLGDVSWAITALLLGLSIPFADLVKIHKDMNFKAFKDDDFSIVQDNIRLFLMVLVSIKGISSLSG